MATDYYPVFDTCIFSKYNEQLKDIIYFSLMPTVVLFELVASSTDKSTYQKFEALRIALNKKNQILTPTMSDWWETSRVIRNLYLRTDIQDSKIKTLRNDALIARLATKNKGFVVTEDIDDFKIIRREMPDLKVISDKEFFGSQH
jgi:predicted nucleic acid-binding protein